MINFESLKSANKKIQSTSVNKSDNYDSLLSEAIDFIQKFNKTKYRNKDLLIKASEKLMECSKLKSNRVEAYVFQAYIAYILGNVELTNKYLGIAIYMDSESELVKNFREMMIYQARTPQKNTIITNNQQNDLEAEKEINIPVKINKISRLSKLN